MSLSEAGFYNLSDLDNSTKFLWNIDLQLSTFILIFIVIIILVSILYSMFGGNAYESFINGDNEFYSYKENLEYSNYASVPLTAIEDEQSIIFGQATRMITSDPQWNTKESDPLNPARKREQGNELFFNIEIFANLYILGGQVYDDIAQTPYNQYYTVALTNPKTKEIVLLGNLQKDNDGLYRLKYKTPVKGQTVNLVDYTIVSIVYSAEDLTGKVVNSKVIIQGDLNKIP